MTDLEQMEQRALTLLNEVRAEYPLVSSEVASNLALCRAIEQHEAFRQEVSDAVEKHLCTTASSIQIADVTRENLARFIIAKPDPLVEVISEVRVSPRLRSEQEMADEFRAAIEARGGKIVWGEG